MSQPTNIYVLDPYHDDAINLLKLTANINLILPHDPERFKWHGKADGIILRSETRLTGEDFAKATPRLRVVVKQGVGVDNIDLEGAKEHGITVYNTPGLNSEAVAELTMASTLALSRRICELDRRIRAGDEIIRSQSLGISMFRKTVGIVGMGNIGKVVAEKWLNAFECKIVGYDPVAPVDVWPDIEHQRVTVLHDLFQQADVITLHVPLNSSTKGMIGSRELELMKPTAILVNCARGGIIDEGALLHALQQKMIWGASLDVTEIEPMTLAAYPKLLQCENLVVTPHIGASTIEHQSRSGMAVIEILLKALSGENVPGRLV